MNKKLTKRLSTNLLLLLAAFALFSSCSEDNKEAFKLNGEWYGDFGMYYTYTYRNQTRTFNCYDTKIKFTSDIMYSAHGTAVQVDYYRDGPYEYIYYNIDWEINDGVITMWYHWASQWNTTIHDYSLTMNHFTGYFGNSNQTFELYPLSNYSWSITNSHYVSYGYGYDQYSNYSDGYPDYSDFTRGTEDETADSVNEAKPDSVVMRGSNEAIPAPEDMHFGNRFLDKRN